MQVSRFISPVRLSIGWSLSFLLAACASLTMTSVNDAEFVRIGGIEQWITIRGANRESPILLIVHGGPGDVQSPLTSTYEPYEREFTVVQWDQRGAGKTYLRNRKTIRELALERMVDDGIELTDYLRRRFGKEKIVVLGHSWGTILALRMVRQRPEWFAAYVGTGQVASWRSCVQVQWNYLQARATATRDLPTLNRLREIGAPDPYDAMGYLSWRSPLYEKFLGRADAVWLGNLRASIESTATDMDIEVIQEAAQFSGRALFDTVMATDLETSAPAISIPLFFIQGHEDVHTPADAALQYFKKIKAPSKSMVIIEGAGHFAMMTHREVFLKALEPVRRLAMGEELRSPLVIASRSGQARR